MKEYYLQLQRTFFLSHCKFLTEKSEHTSCSMAMLDAETGKLQEHCHLMNDPQYCDAWIVSLTDKFGSFAQGVGSQVSRTDTIFFIHTQ